jgi:AmiR/NasT family two-component response regulator
MSHRRISEDEAYKLLRQSAMNQNRRLGEVAEAIIATAELLPANQQRRHD